MEGSLSISAIVMLKGALLPPGASPAPAGPARLFPFPRPRFAARPRRFSRRLCFAIILANRHKRVKRAAGAGKFPIAPRMYPAASFWDCGLQTTPAEGYYVLYRVIPRPAPAPAGHK